MTILTLVVNERHDVLMRVFPKGHWVVWTGLIVVLTQLINRLVSMFLPELIVTNPSALFGLINQPVLIFLIATLGLLLAWHIIRGQWQHPWVQWGMTLIVAGALSNLLDRLVFAGVVDYLRLGSWSVFNLADSEIVVGVLFLLLIESTAKPTPPGRPSRPK